MMKRRMLEDLSVAATMAEAGLWDDAREIAAELKNLGPGAREKVLLVNGQPTLSKDVLGYAVDLSRRMESDLVILMPEPRDKTAAEGIRQEVAQMSLAAGDTARDARIVCLMTKGELSQIAAKVLRLAKRVEIALLHGIEDKTPYKRLRIPLYTASV